jgi:D-alanyl-D-alanine carboxypeptidase
MIIAIIITSAILVLLVALLVSAKWNNKPDPAYVLKFIKTHPEQASLYVMRNGEVIADVQSGHLMPLASVVKVIVAIEFSKQAAANKINALEQVLINDIEKFYIPGFDGNAHTIWLKNMESHNIIKNGCVDLLEIAKGMINHSSNANTEYLMMRLGLESINQNLTELDLPQHQLIYPFVSSLYIPYEIRVRNYPNLSKAEAIQQTKNKLAEMSTFDFAELAKQIHLKLSADTTGAYKNQARITDWYDSDFDKMNSVRFIASTTMEYASILKKINSRTFFDAAVHKYLDVIMEGILQNPANREWLDHAGRKGGSTAYILTDTLYATDKKGNKTECAVFFNNLQPHQSLKLQKSLNSFELFLLQNDMFREKVKKTLS